MLKHLTTLLTLASMPTIVCAENNTAAAQSPYGSMVMIVVMMALMYFLMLRPQNKRAKAHQQLLSNISQGDEVIVQGGMLAVVAKISGDFFIVRLAESVEVPVQKQAVTQVLPKGTLKSL